MSGAKKEISALGKLADLMDKNLSAEVKIAIADRIAVLNAWLAKRSKLATAIVVFCSLAVNLIQLFT